MTEFVTKIISSDFELKLQGSDRISEKKIDGCT